MSLPPPVNATVVTQNKAPTSPLEYCLSTRRLSESAEGSIASATKNPDVNGHDLTSPPTSILALPYVPAFSRLKKKWPDTFIIPRLPVEVREMVFKNVILDHFHRIPTARTPLYRTDGEPWVTLPGATSNGLMTLELPPFESVLLADTGLWREFFAVRTRMSTLRFEPTLSFDWRYESPRLSPTLRHDQDGYIITEITSEDTPWVVPVIRTKEDVDSAGMRGWEFDFVSMKSMSPLMRHNIKAIEILPLYLNVPGVANLIDHIDPDMTLSLKAMLNFIETGHIHTPKLNSISIILPNFLEPTYEIDPDVEDAYYRTLRHILLPRFKSFLKDIGLKSLSLGIEDDQDEPAEFLVAPTGELISEALGVECKESNDGFHYKMTWAAANQKKLVWTDAGGPA